MLHEGAWRGRTLPYVDVAPTGILAGVAPDVSWTKCGTSAMIRLACVTSRRLARYDAPAHADGFQAYSERSHLLDADSDLSECLLRARTGDDSALNDIMDRCYGELRQLASRVMRRSSPRDSLVPTALVSELYVKLLDAKELTARDKPHFLAIAVKAMQQILIDHVRARKALKRGGQRRRMTLSLLINADTPNDVSLDVLAAIEKLANRSARQAEVVTLKLLAGLSLVEIAEVLHISKDTVKDHWEFGRAWIKRKMEI